MIEFGPFLLDETFEADIERLRELLQAPDHEIFRLMAAIALPALTGFLNGGKVTVTDKDGNVICEMDPKNTRFVLSDAFIAKSVRRPSP